MALPYRPEAWNDSDDFALPNSRARLARRLVPCALFRSTMAAFTREGTLPQGRCASVRVRFSGHLLRDYCLLKRRQREYVGRAEVLRVSLERHAPGRTVVSGYLAAVHVAADALEGESVTPPVLSFQAGVHALAALSVLWDLLDLGHPNRRHCRMRAVYSVIETTHRQLCGRRRLGTGTPLASYKSSSSSSETCRVPPPQPGALGL